MSQKTVVAALAALSLVLAGCGSSSASPTPNFTAKANAICASADRHVEALPPSGTSLRDLAGQAEAETTILQREYTALAALTAPSSEQAQFAAALSATKQELSLINKLTVAVRADNSEQILTDGLRGEQLTAVVETAMARLGLSDCALAVEPGGGG
jgi:hypothetical protein